MQGRQDKAALRKALLANRQQVDAEVRREWDARIVAHVLAWWQRERFDRIGVYWPMRAEPDLRGAYEALAAAGATLALPIVTARDAPLAFAAWKPGDMLERDAMGVSIPAAPAVRIRPQAVLVPCVGFNGRRQRLGYGGGFYDRTLEADPMASVGIAYSCCRCEFEGDAHDLALDRLITELGES